MKIKSNLKQHNSEPQMSREDEKLVRISSNNEDEITCSSCLDDNVKRICTEINDFCTKSNVGINIAEYMERKSSVEIDLVCDNVRDVIVIPSAEAILDTGQSVNE